MAIVDRQFLAARFNIKLFSFHPEELVPKLFETKAVSMQTALDRSGDEVPAVARSDTSFHANVVKESQINGSSSASALENPLHMPPNLQLEAEARLYLEISQTSSSLQTIMINNHQYQLSGWHYCDPIVRSTGHGTGLVSKTKSRETWLNLLDNELVLYGYDRLGAIYQEFKTPKRVQRLLFTMSPMVSNADGSQFGILLDILVTLCSTHEVYFVVYNCKSTQTELFPLSFVKEFYTTVSDAGISVSERATWVTIRKYYYIRQRMIFDPDKALFPR
jgi:hypothetical protein